jgi:ribosomal protein L5
MHVKVFPETTDENIQDVFGLGATLVTTSKNKKETKRRKRKN